MSPKVDVIEPILKNGKTLRDWLIFGSTCVGIIVGGTIAWEALRNQVCNNEEKMINNQVEVMQKLHDLKVTGTDLSRANQLTIIELQGDVKWTKEAVGRIERKIDRQDMGGISGIGR